MKPNATSHKSSKSLNSEIVKAAIELGAKKAKIVSPKKVVTGHWVRWKCRFGCSGFQSNLMCPPYSPLPAETRLMLDQYKRAVLFEADRGQPKKLQLRWRKNYFWMDFIWPLEWEPAHAAFARRRSALSSKAVEILNWRALQWKAAGLTCLPPREETALPLMSFAMRMTLSTTLVSSLSTETKSISENANINSTECSTDKQPKNKFCFLAFPLF
jgi:hypothetical protein